MNIFGVNNNYELIITNYTVQTHEYLKLYDSIDN